MKCILSVLLLFPSFLFAQTGGYKLQDLLQKVVTTYPSIKAREASVQAANYYVSAAKKDYLPDLVVGHQYQYATDNGLEGSYYSNEGTTVSTSGGIRDHNVYEPVFGSFTTLMVNWHLFDFGKVEASVRLAESRVAVAKADYANAVFQQQVRVADAYLLLVLSQKMVSVQQNNLARSQTFQLFVRSHAEAGLLPGVDTSAANAEVAKAQLALLQSQQYVAQQQNNLEQLSGVPADSIRMDTSFLQRLPSYVVNDLTTTANPILDYGRKQLTAQYNQMQVLKKSVLPTVNIIGLGWARGSGVDRSTKELSSNIGDGLPYQAYNYMAGVALKWNITSVAKVKQQYLGAAQELEATRYRVDEEASILQREVKNAELQYLTALQQTRVAPLQYKAALDAYNLSNARYQAGLTSLNEVIQAYYVLNRADVDNAVAVNNVWRALVQHVAATGTLNNLTSQLP